MLCATFRHMCAGPKGKIHGPFFIYVPTYYLVNYLLQESSCSYEALILRSKDKDKMQFVNLKSNGQKKAKFCAYIFTDHDNSRALLWTEHNTT